MLDDLFDSLDADPAFRSFLLDGQTVLLEDYLRIRPEAAGKIAALAASGRLQTGPWYVLADELTPSAESLLRNLLAGAADAERIGGRLDALYSPDAFGHPAAWPSLAREFGIAHGVLWRGLAPRAGDGDLFRWRAPDGAEVLLYHLPRDGYEIGATLSAEPARLSGEWARIRDTLVGRARSHHIAVFVGADHHAAHAEPARLRDLLAELEPAHEVRISRLDEFLAAAATGAHSLPDISGELRWSYGYTWTLQGTHGTRLPLKRANARAELLLERYAEPLATLVRRAGGSDSGPLLRAAWRTLIRAHFHDTICGTAHDAAAVAAARRIADAALTAREVGKSALHHLSGHDPDRARRPEARRDPALLLWNPVPRPRAGVTIADISFFRHDVLVGPPSDRSAGIGAGYEPFSLVDDRGRIFPVQVIERREAIERIGAARHYPDADAVDVVRVAFESPQLRGCRTAVMRPGAPATLRALPSSAWARGSRLGNEPIEVTIETDGRLTILDRRTGQRFPHLLGAESESDAGDAYTFERVGQEPPVLSRSRAAARIRAAGPLAAVSEVRWDDLDASFRMFVSVHAHEPLVRIALELENRATDRRLRLRLPLGLADVPVIAGAAFGSEHRASIDPCMTGFPAERPVSTAPAHRFAGCARGDRGLALLAPGHFEYEWTPRGDLLFTLLRSIGELSRDDLQSRPGHAAWPTPIPFAQCLGRDRIELALAPVAVAALEGSGVHQLWEDAFLAPRGLWIRDAEVLQPSDVGVELEGAGLVLSAMKPAERGDGMILRCYNATSSERTGTWRVSPSPKQAWRVRADETTPEPVPIVSRGVILFTAGPHEIVTHLIPGSAVAS